MSAKPYDSYICQNCHKVVISFAKEKNFTLPVYHQSNRSVQEMEVDQSVLSEPQMLTRSSNKRSMECHSAFLSHDQPMDTSDDLLPSTSQNLPSAPPAYDDLQMFDTPPNKRPKLDFNTPQSTVTSILSSVSSRDVQDNDPDWDLNNDSVKTHRRGILNQYLINSGYPESILDFNVQKPWVECERRPQNRVLATVAAATISAIQAVGYRNSDYIKIYDSLVSSRMVPMAFEGNAYQSEILRDFVISFGQMPTRRERIQLTSGFAPRYAFAVLDQYNIPERIEERIPGVEYFSPFKFTRHVYDMGMKHFMTYGHGFQPVEAKKYTRKKFDPKVLKCIIEYATSTDTLARVAYGAWYSKELGLTMPKVRFS